MKKLSQCAGQEALSLALSLFARSTLVESSPAMGHMHCALEYIAKGAYTAACRSYHDALGCMLKSDALHISGSLWMDEILHTLLMKDSDFSKMLCAQQPRLAGLRDVLAEELQTLCALSTLNTKTVISMIKESSQHKVGQKDNISVMSAAVWAGGHSKPLPRMEAEEKGGQPISVPVAFTPLEYDAGAIDKDALFGLYASGDALEEIYSLLIEKDCWENMLPDFSGFFSSCGTGMFLKDKVFRVEGSSLVPLPEAEFEPIIPVSMYERQHVALMENTIRFMRDEKAQRILLTGESGLGKTAHVLSLTEELPELRLILAGERDMEHLPRIIEHISCQPLKFLLLLDDIDVNGDEFRLFASRMTGFMAMPGNLLIYATARKGTSGAFSCSLYFPYPNPQQFEALINDFLENADIAATKQEIHNAAVDHQVDAREKLTVTGAIAVAEKLIDKLR